MSAHRCVDLPRQSKLRQVTCTSSPCYSMSAQDALHLRLRGGATCCKPKSARVGSIPEEGPLSPLCLAPQPSRPAWVWRNRIFPISPFTLSSDLLPAVHPTSSRA